MRVKPVAFLVTLCCLLTFGVSATETSVGLVETSRGQSFQKNANSPDAADVNRFGWYHNGGDAYRAGWLKANRSANCPNCDAKSVIYSNGDGTWQDDAREDELNRWSDKSKRRSGREREHGEAGAEGQDVKANVTPEPTTIILFGSGLLAMVGKLRRKCIA